MRHLSISCRQESRRGLKEEFPVLQVRPFRVLISTDWSVTGAVTWLCCFSGPGAEIHLRLRSYLQEKRLPRTQDSCFPSFAPCQDHLYLAVNCLASSAVCLSLPIPLAFLAFYYPDSFSPPRLPSLESFRGEEGGGFLSLQ